MNSESSVIFPAVEIGWSAVEFERVEHHLDRLPVRDRLRAAEYGHKDARAHFVFGRLLLRTMLADFGERFDVELSFGAHGKPRIDGGPAFNVSHSNGVVVCGLHGSIELGVDVEAPWRRTDFDAIAPRFFAPSEVAALDQLGDDERRRAFFELWTLKEALLKGTGKGLRTPLSSVTFRRDETWQLDHELSQEWSLRQWRLTTGHLVALATMGECDSDAPRQMSLT